ncbi:hypothetical protein M4D50_01090 [Rothia sp. p3-SID1597]|nr:hypothetical protein [Rothia sp. p3-SID1597]
MSLKARITETDRDPEQTGGARVIAEALLSTIEENISNHPRSQQKRIGPSEIGVECTRKLIHKLAGHTEPDRGPAWKPTVGTACHSQMEEWFSTRSDEFKVEQRVLVGQIGDQYITGSTDLFIPSEGAVIDWKFVGRTRLNSYRSKGPGQQYRVQAHLYGKGWETAGYQVNTVMIAFLPRDGELSDAYFWWEPFDPMVALMALVRANQVYQDIANRGVEKVLQAYEPCTDRWCPWCAPGNRVQAIKNSGADMFASA